jgi:hypothetical protein
MIRTYLLSVASFVGAAAVLTSCMVVGAVSPTNVYSYEDEVACRGPSSAFAEKFIAATTPSGFTVSGRGPNTVSVQREGSGALALLVGKIERMDIEATWPTPRKINLRLIAAGNLGAGDEASVQRYVADIKSRLMGNC